MPERRIDHILTSLGSDGACSAAMVLQKIPDATIEITSARRLLWTLAHGLEKETLPRELHICGVGEGGHLEEILDTLKQYKRQKVKVLWYCGRGYLHEFEERLQSCCTPVFLRCDSNAEAIFQYFKLPKTKTTDLLITLAREYVQSSKSIPKSHRDWHGFFEYTGAKYFKFDETNSFIQAINRIARSPELNNEDLKEIVHFRSSRAYIPLGKSKRMKELRKIIKRIGPISEPVLITGPTGSGKEVAARLLHESSGLKGSFVPVNCAILSTNTDLAHDRLFGHTVGAYTGAKDSQPGAFVLADEGTLFLDEIAELPLSVQTQLLRVLEEKAITPLGTMNSLPVNIRLIAATNQSLPQLIAEGKFREDLYYRLNVLTLSIPPLIERFEDLKDIAGNILYDLKKNGFPLQLTRQDWSSIYNYSWPGNIRQFLHTIKRAAYMNLSVTEVLQSEDSEISHSLRDMELLKNVRLFIPASIDEVQPEAIIRKTYIQYVFKLFDGNITHAAEALNVAKNTLKKWLSE